MFTSNEHINSDWVYSSWYLFFEQNKFEKFHHPTRWIFSFDSKLHCISESFYLYIPSSKELISVENGVKNKINWERCLLKFSNLFSNSRFRCPIRILLKSLTVDLSENIKKCVCSFFLFAIIATLDGAWRQKKSVCSKFHSKLRCLVIEYLLLLLGKKDGFVWVTSKIFVPIQNYLFMRPVCKLINFIFRFQFLYFLFKSVKHKTITNCNALTVRLTC